MCILFKYFCCCFVDQKHKKFKRKSRDKKAAITLSYSQRSRKHYTNRDVSAALQESSPSHVATNQLTHVYDLPEEEFKTPEDIIASMGYQKTTKVLGGGMSCVVYEAIRLSDGKTVALKVMELSGTKVKIEAKNELFIMEKISHPHVIQIYNHFIVKDLTKGEKWFAVYIFMRLAEKGSLSGYIRSLETHLDETTARRWFAQMVSAVNHMHSQGFAHRDLKMGNILFNENMNVLVADFGLSEVSYRESKGGVIRSQRFSGTLPYMAPEILSTRDDINASYNPFETDIWALGVILFVMINRTYPFSYTEKGPVIQQINSQKEKNEWSKPSDWNRYATPSKDFIDIMKRLLTFNPKDRIKMKDICRHKWIRRDISLIENKIQKQN